MSPFLYFNRYGRKKSTTFGLVIASISLIVAVAIPYKQSRKGILFASIHYKVNMENSIYYAVYSGWYIVLEAVLY